MLRTKILILGAAVSLATINTASAMSGPPQPTSKQIQAKAAADAANSIHFTSNEEIKNIKKRLELTSKPGALGYILLLNNAGQPILYTTVAGKLTSGGKRLTPKKQLLRGDRGNYQGDFVVDAPSDEGTYGSSNPYVYFWSTSGQYYQWSGMYLYSDQPFRLSVKPLVIDVK